MLCRGRDVRDLASETRHHPAVHLHTTVASRYLPMTKRMHRSPTVFTHSRMTRRRIVSAQRRGGAGPMRVSPISEAFVKTACAPRRSRRLACRAHLRFGDLGRSGGAGNRLCAAAEDGERDGAAFVALRKPSGRSTMAPDASETRLLGPRGRPTTEKHARAFDGRVRDRRNGAAGSTAASDADETPSGRAQAERMSRRAACAARRAVRESSDASASSPKRPRCPRLGISGRALDLLLVVPRARRERDGAAHNAGREPPS